MPRTAPNLFLDLEPEVTEAAAAGLPLRGSQMDATIRNPDGSGTCNLFLSFSPSVSYRQHPSEVHARAAYVAIIVRGGCNRVKYVRFFTHPSYRSAVFSSKKGLSFLTSLSSHALVSILLPFTGGRNSQKKTIFHSIYFQLILTSSPG